MDLTVYSLLKKYVDNAVAVGTNPEEIRKAISEEMAKLTAGADAKFDTIKEISDWILNDPDGVVKMQSDISALQEDLKN